MNKYHMTIYFYDEIYYETNIDSPLELDAFTSDISVKFNTKDIPFINFAGGDIKYTINRNNVLFYTIEKIDDEE